MKRLKKFLINSRVQQVNPLWLNSEINNAVEQGDDTVNFLLKCVQTGVKKENKINSCLAYCLGITDNINLNKEVQKSGITLPDI